MKEKVANNESNMETVHEWVQRELTPEEEKMINMMVDDARNAEDEADAAESRLLKLDTTLYELTKRRDAFRKQIADTEEEHERALAPVISKLRTEMIDLKDEIKVDQEKLQGVLHERDKLDQVLQYVTDENVTVSDDLKTLELETEKLCGVLEKIKERFFVLEDAAKTLRRRDDRLIARVSALDQDMEKQSEAIDTITKTHTNESNILESVKTETEATNKSIDEQSAVLETLSFKQDAMLETKAVCEIERHGSIGEMDTVLSTLKLTTKQKDLLLKRTKRAQIGTESVTDEVKSLTEKQREAELTVASMRKECLELENDLHKYRNLFDQEMAKYLREKDGNQDTEDAVETGREEVNLLLQKTSKERQEQKNRVKLLRETELAVRAADTQRQLEATALKRSKEGVTAAKSILTESNRRLKDVQKRNEQQHALKLLAEEQRIKLRSLAVSTKNAAADVADRLRTLAGEIGSLCKDSEDKGEDLENARRTHRDARTETNTVRVTLHRSNDHKRRILEKKDEKTSELLSTKNVAQSLKRDNDRIKKDLSSLKANRDVIGASLLDRDDELVSLYEKSKLQEEVLKAGEVELNKRISEVKVLELELEECVRKESLANATASKVPALDEQVTLLRQQLVEEKRKLEQLEIKAEDPRDPSRRRDLGGENKEVEDEDVLRGKLFKLEMLEAEKDLSLKKKDQQLVEISALSNALRVKAAESRADTLELARSVVSAQSKLRQKQRETEALAAELAMYVASAGQFGEILGNIQSALSVAKENVENGLPPDEDAQREWSRVVRYEAVAARMSQQKQAEHDLLENKPPPEDPFEESNQQENAASRPNAYIPSHKYAEGVPMPYGKNAPFKPGKSPLALRHYRKDGETERDDDDAF